MRGMTDNDNGLLRIPYLACRGRWLSSALSARRAKRFVSGNECSVIRPLPGPVRRVSLQVSASIIRACRGMAIIRPTPVLNPHRALLRGLHPEHKATDENEGSLQEVFCYLHGSVRAVRKGSIYEDGAGSCHLNLVFLALLTSSPVSPGAPNHR